VSGVSTRLVRLLNMVPYLQANPRITYEEAALDLGVSVEQLRADLEQLWLCGLPGYGPGDLIDFEMSAETIEVTFSAGMDHPLRLTSPEATGILVALRALLDVPGMVDPQAARSAIAKIESAAGTALGEREGAAAAVDEQAPIESQAAAAVRAAVRDGRALTIDYYSASHDELSSRTVDPIRVVLVDDLDARLADLAARNVAVGEIETYGNGVRHVVVTDPEGNTVAFGEVPAGS